MAARITHVFRCCQAIAKNEKSILMLLMYPFLGPIEDIIWYRFQSHEEEQATYSKWGKTKNSNDCRYHRFLPIKCFNRSSTTEKRWALGECSHHMEREGYYLRGHRLRWGNCSVQRRGNMEDSQIATHSRGLQPQFCCSTTSQVLNMTMKQITEMLQAYPISLMNVMEARSWEKLELEGWKCTSRKKSSWNAL